MPAWVLVDSLTAEGVRRQRWSEFRVPGRKKLHSERMEDLQRVPFKYLASTDEQIHLRKLPEARTVPVPTSQAGKPHNSEGTA